MKTFVVSYLAFYVSGLVVGCGGTPATPAKSEGDAAAAPESNADAAAPTNFKEQVARGGELFGAKCATCHGQSGQGSGEAPRVVGVGALPLDPPRAAKVRKTQFVTAADVANFVVENMPPNAPNSLSTEDYFSILAFDLKANGIDLGDKKLDAALAATLVIPR